MERSAKEPLAGQRLLEREGVLIRDLIGRVAKIGFVGQSGEEKLPFVVGKLPFVVGKLPFVVGKLPFIEGKLPFIEGKLPFVEGKLPFVERKLPSDVLPGRALDYKPLCNNDLR